MDLSPNETKILKVLQKGTLSQLESSMASDLREKETMSAASWLRSKGLVEISEESKVFFTVNEEGEKYAEEGLPERRAVEWLNQFGESPLEDVPLDDNEKKIFVMDTPGIDYFGLEDLKYRKINEIF